MESPDGDGGTKFQFTPAEVAEMETILTRHSSKMPAKEVHAALADKFSFVRNRCGQGDVQEMQVAEWFQAKRDDALVANDSEKSNASSVPSCPAYGFADQDDNDPHPGSSQQQGQSRRADMSGPSGRENLSPPIMNNQTALIPEFGYGYAFMPLVNVYSIRPYTQPTSTEAEFYRSLPHDQPNIFAMQASMTPHMYYMPMPYMQPLTMFGQLHSSTRPFMMNSDFINPYLLRPAAQHGASSQHVVSSVGSREPDSSTSDTAHSQRHYKSRPEPNREGAEEGQQDDLRAPSQCHSHPPFFYDDATWDSFEPGQRVPDGRMFIKPVPPKQFEPDGISTMIRHEILRTNWTGPYYTYSDAPKEDKETWWRLFQEKFAWHPQKEKEARKHYKEKIQKVISDAFSKGRKGKDVTEFRLPEFVRPEHVPIILQKQQNDAKLARQSATGKQNAKRKKSAYTHHHGSAPSYKAYNKLAAKRGGSIPPTEFYKFTQTSKKTGIIDPNALQFSEDMKMALEARVAKDPTFASLPRVQQELQLWPQIQGTSDDNFKGLGSQATLYVSQYRSSSSPSWYNKPHESNDEVTQKLEQLVAQVRKEGQANRNLQMEARRINEEARRINEEVRRDKQHILSMLSAQQYTSRPPYIGMSDRPGPFQLGDDTDAP